MLHEVREGGAAGRPGTVVVTVVPPLVEHRAAPGGSPMVRAGPGARQPNNAGPHPTAPALPSASGVNCGPGPACCSSQDTPLHAAVAGTPAGPKRSPAARRRRGQRRPGHPGRALCGRPLRRPRRLPGAPWLRTSARSAVPVSGPRLPATSAPRPGTADTPGTLTAVRALRTVRTPADSACAARLKGHDPSDVPLAGAPVVGRATAALAGRHLPHGGRRRGPHRRRSGRRPARHPRPDQLPRPDRVLTSVSAGLSGPLPGHDTQSTPVKSVWRRQGAPARIRRSEP